MQQSEIEPLFPVKNMADQQNSKLYTVRGIYTLEDIDVKKTIEGPIIFKDIGSLLADILIFIGGGVEVDMDPIPVSLEDMDLEVIKVAIIQGLNFKILKDESGKANLKFIKKLRIYIADNAEDEPKEDQWLLKYDSSNRFTQARNENCDYKCLRFDVNKVNLLKFAKEGSKEIYLIPFLEVGKTSKRDFTLGGQVKFKLRLLLPI